MKRIAEKIIVRDEVKSDFMLDQDGQVTDISYDYIEYDILDKGNNVLHTGTTSRLDSTAEEIRKNLGIKFGFSAWITND